MNIWADQTASARWDGPYFRGRYLRRTPEVVAALIDAFASDPQTAGRLANLWYEPPPEYTSNLFLFATWVPTGAPAIIKPNAGPWERYWMTSIDRQSPGLLPRVFASGDQIGPHALQWLVLEQVPYQLSHEWGIRMYDLLAQAAVGFQYAARAVDRRCVSLVCLHATRDSMQRGLQAGCPGPLQRLLDRLEDDWVWVNEQCSQEICFGDLTMGNSLSTTPAPGGDRILLIDPLPRIAPWAWDGAYCQTLDANTDVRLIHRMAEARQAMGLPVPERPVLDRLATLLLAWLAAHRWWNTAFRQEDPAWVKQVQRYIENAAS